MPNLKENVYKVKWCRYISEGVPEPGDEVANGEDIFQVLSIKRNFNSIKFGNELANADLEVEVIFLSDPDRAKLYEKGDCFVGPV